MTTITLTDLARRLLTAARASGHPILSTGPGRWHTTDRPTTLTVDGEQAPNDRLDVARDIARSRVEWVHAVVPTATDAVRLAAALDTTAWAAVPRQAPGRPRPDGGPWRTLVRRPTGRGPVRSGDPRRVPLATLAEQMPIGVVTVTEYTDGQAVHVVEIPAAWLTHLTAPETGR